MGSRRQRQHNEAALQSQEQSVRREANNAELRTSSLQIKRNQRLGTPPLSAFIFQVIQKNDRHRHRIQATIVGRSHQLRQLLDGPRIKTLLAGTALPPYHRIAGQAAPVPHAQPRHERRTVARIALRWRNRQLDHTVAHLETQLHRRLPPCRKRPPIRSICGITSGRPPGGFIRHTAFQQGSYHRHKRLDTAYAIPPLRKRCEKKKCNRSVTSIATPSQNNSPACLLPARENMLLEISNRPNCKQWGTAACPDSTVTKAAESQDSQEAS